jgi:hypothetical protein
MQVVPLDGTAAQRNSAEPSHAGWYVANWG